MSDKEKNKKTQDAETKKAERLRKLHELRLKKVNKENFKENFHLAFFFIVGFKITCYFLE